MSDNGDFLRIVSFFLIAIILFKLTTSLSSILFLIFVFAIVMIMFSPKLQFVRRVFFKEINKEDIFESVTDKLEGTIRVIATEMNRIDQNIERCMNNRKMIEQKVLKIRRDIITAGNQAQDAYNSGSSEDVVKSLCERAAVLNSYKKDLDDSLHGIDEYMEKLQRTRDQLVGKRIGIETKIETIIQQKEMQDIEKNTGISFSASKMEIDKIISEADVLLKDAKVQQEGEKQVRNIDKKYEEQDLSKADISVDAMNLFNNIKAKSNR